MLVFGNSKSIPSNEKGNWIILNLLSIVKGYPTAGILPLINNFNYSEKQFDINYANWIMSNSNIFFEFFSKIIYNLYLGMDVYLIAETNQVYLPIMESIQKFIQQRYGYNSAIINEPEELDLVDKDEAFSITGLQNLDVDKERFSYIYACHNTYVTENGIPHIKGYEEGEM